MKIYVLGSNSFIKEMVDCRDRLQELGVDGWIHPEYEEHVRGGRQQLVHGLTYGEHAAWKRQHDYIRQHYKHILDSDAILIVDLTKNGKKNYIGGNCLMEMGMAYVNDKKIFLLNDIPAYVTYVDEILAMDPICLRGKLTKIAKE